MSPNDSSDFDEKLFDFSSFGSSDLESFLEEDKANNGNDINKEWEAIERTLYQETGQQVTDPELLRECKLWRETFPHFRVKGTKVQAPDDAKAADEDDKETEKSIQTQGNHSSLNKVNERRENIKNKVVGELVERLITKFNLIKKAKAHLPEPGRKGLPAPETRGNLPDAVSVPKRNGNGKGTEEKTSGSSEEKESYFERGKLFRVEEDPGIFEEDVEERFGRISESWDDPETKSPPGSREIPKKNRNLFKMPNACKSEIFLSKPAERVGGGPKAAKFCAPLDSLSNAAKPFETTKKIDKKYEGLVGRIMERRSCELQPMGDCRTGSFGEGKSYRESLEELRIGSGFDEFSRRNKNLPRINNFCNNWLERGEANYYFPTKSRFPLQKGDRARTKAKPLGDASSYKSHMSKNEIEEKLMEELSRKMLTGYKPPKKSGPIEDASSRRPKPVGSGVADRTQKCSNCVDLAKKNKKASRSRQSKGSLEGGPNPRGRGKPINPNAAKGSGGTKNGILPPIESGIICTELKGRPKIGARRPINKF